jgi:hypothetical protein
MIEELLESKLKGWSEILGPSLGSGRHEGHKGEFQIFFDRETLREILASIQGEITAQEMDLVEKRKYLVLMFLRSIPTNASRGCARLNELQ